MREKFTTLTLFSLLMVLALALSGCGEECIGSGECTVTVNQSGGLYIDDSKPKSSCGKSATYNSSSDSYTGGCIVQNMIDNRNRTYGTKDCNCSK